MKELVVPRCCLVYNKFRIAIHYRARGGEWRMHFRPRMVICAVILSSTNKWDFEPGLLSLVINHVYSVAG